MSGSSSSNLSGWYSSRRGICCPRAKIRSQVLSRSRCLIDLTTDGLALSKSTAEIHLGIKRRIIGRRDKYSMKTRGRVETPLIIAFVARRAERRTPPIRFPARSSNGGPGACSCAPRRERFRPCANRAVDGIFRPEAARPDGVFQCVWGSCRWQELVMREARFAAMTVGGI